MNENPNILASRWIRLVAAIIDTLVLIAAAIPFIFILPALGIEPTRYSNETVYQLILSVFGASLFLCVNGYLLQKNGQTIGKKMLGIRIVATTGERLTLWRLFSLRYAIIYIVSGIGLYGWLVALLDPMMIFMKDRRCLHDHFAGTIVVKRSIEPAPPPYASPAAGVASGEA